MEIDAIVDAIARTDYLRREPAPGPRKEWMHFCAHAPDLDLMVNLSFSDRVTGRDPEGRAAVARLVLLATDARGVVADVDTFEEGDFSARAGSLSVRMGDASLMRDDGGFTLRARLRDGRASVDLRLRPETAPEVVPRLPLGDAPPLAWVIVPRLRATGVVTLDGRATRLDAAPAYHDHNWGRFRWGNDFAWEWGYALARDPACPWTIVFARLTDRARLTARAQSVMVWRGARRARVFRNEEVRTTREGLLGADALARVPRVMGLLSSRDGSDVPRRFSVDARARADEVALRFEPSRVVEVIVPNDADLGATRIHEVTGEVTVRGRVGGEELAFEARGFFEFLEA